MTVEVCQGRYNRVFHQQIQSIEQADFGYLNPALYAIAKACCSQCTRCGEMITRNQHIGRKTNYLGLDIANKPTPKATLVGRAADILLPDIEIDANSSYYNLYIES